MNLLVLIMSLLFGQQCCSIPQHTSVGGGGAPGNNLVFYQACNHGTGSGTSYSLKIDSTGTCSATSNPLSGDLVILYFGASSNAGSLSCSDTLGNSWHSSWNSTNQEAYCYSVFTTGGLDTISTTSSFNTSAQPLSLEFKNPAGTPLDGSAQFNSIASGTAWTLPSITTTNANDVVISCGNSHTGSVTWTAGGSFVIPTDGQQAATNNSAFCSYQLVTTATTYNPTATAGSSQSGHGMSIGFKSQ